MAKPPVQRHVQCYHCHHRFEVGAMTKSTVCPSCHKALIIEDVVVRTLSAVRKIQTCGKLVVEKKGRVTATLVEAIEGVEVMGVMEAKVVTLGAVRIAKTARWKGDCRASSLSVELGSVITSGYFEIYPHPDASAPEGAGANGPTVAPDPPPAPPTPSTGRAPVRILARGSRARSP